MSDHAHQGYRRVIRASRKAARLDQAAEAAGVEPCGQCGSRHPGLVHAGPFMRPETAISGSAQEADRSVGVNWDGPAADQSRSDAQRLAHPRGLEVDQPMPVPLTPTARRILELHLDGPVAIAVMIEHRVRAVDGGALIASGHLVVDELTGDTDLTEQGRAALETP